MLLDETDHVLRDDQVLVLDRFPGPLLHMVIQERPNFSEVRQDLQGRRQSILHVVHVLGELQDPGLPQRLVGKKQKRQGRIARNGIHEAGPDCRHRFQQHGMNLDNEEGTVPIPRRIGKVGLLSVDEHPFVLSQEHGRTVDIIHHAALPNNDQFNVIMPMHDRAMLRIFRQAVPTDMDGVVQPVIVEFRGILPVPGHRISVCHSFLSFRKIV